MVSRKEIAISCAAPQEVHPPNPSYGRSLACIALEHSTLGEKRYNMLGSIWTNGIAVQHNLGQATRNPATINENAVPNYQPTAGLVDPNRNIDGRLKVSMSLIS